MNRGFSLVELLVGAFIFTIVALGIYRGFFGSSQITLLGRIKTEAALLAEEQFELIHNLRFQDIGISGGIPAGVLPRTQSLARSGVTFNVMTTIRNIDDPFDGTIGGTPNDTAPADYKEVTLQIGCSNCLLTTPLVYTTTVAPKNLETTSNNGAIFIKVIDANGQPVPQATVAISNPSAHPAIAIDETTDNAGWFQLVDVPPGANVYNVTVSKSGYSSDGTSPITLDNPNPILPPLTVSTGVVTSATFVIDKVGDLAVTTINDQCAAAGSVPFTLTGKLLGTDPSVYKYQQSFSTDGGGQKTVTNLEWDNYDLQVTGSSWTLAGTSPFLPVTLLPGATQNVSLVVAPKHAKSLLVIVRDAVTGLPVSDAAVTLKRGSTTIGTQNTDRGSLAQTDWSGGSGQADWSDATKFASDDGNIDYSSSAGNVKLKKVGSNYAASGNLTSSVFDVGTTASTFYTITWNPQSQPSQTGSNSLKFQLATANTNTATTTWTFLGPDATTATYYTTANGNINATTTGARYLRYKAFLSTANSSRTPTLSDVAITYGSGCLPYGQVLYQNLITATHKITVTKSGYQTYNDTNIPITADWQKVSVSLQPN